MTAFAASGAGSTRPGAGQPVWREVLAPYARPRLGRSLLDIATSVVPYLALWVLMYLSLDISYLLVLALAVPTAGFLVRVFVMFHDCAHGSLLPSKRANAWLGAVLGLLVFAPFLCWRHDHAVHHATSGDLDRRGTGDVRTLTVSEYGALSRRGRIGYRVFRNPLVMFGLGPIAAMVVGPRFVARGARPRMRRSVLGTDLALVLCLVRSGGARCCSFRDPLRSWPPASVCGSSMSSISSRTPTGRAPMVGRMRTPRSGGAPT